MSRLQYSKAALHQQSGLLKRYRQYLPSLDLKRQQLLAERARAGKQLDETQDHITKVFQLVADELPMLADDSISLQQLIRIKTCQIETENLIGVPLPRLERIEIETAPYSFFCKPHWVDLYAIEMREMLALQLHRKVQQQRLKLLDMAVKKITQRVNLFEKILIPTAEENIRKIRIFLSDTERAAVVRAKMTKQKRREQSSWPSSP